MRQKDKASGSYSAYLPRLIGWVFVNHFVYVFFNDVVPFAIDIDISDGKLKHKSSTHR